MTWHLELGDDEITARHADGHWTVPIGVLTLAGELATDPPRPEELTNAVGAVADHLDDLVRARPDLVGAPVSMSGPEITAVVAVEVGGAPPLPFVLERGAAEDVFRTVATEPRADRARNPGLDPVLVDRIVAGSCAVVAVLRKLQLDAIEVRP
ncbi:MAG: hypothetical protein U0Q03_11595 [Acidimicrobiales bacterium]